MLKRLKKLSPLFICTVLIPTFFAVVYFGVFAEDVFISESRFVIRTPEKQSSSALGVILKGSGFSQSQEDGYTVQDFILSRDALIALDKELGLRSVYGKGDWVSAFPGFYFDENQENLYLYYKDMVKVKFDPLSSIVVVDARAFEAKDAYEINRRLLEYSESLINKLNDRARKDLIAFSSKEVEQAEKKAKVAALELAKFRNQYGVIDPEKQTSIPLQQIARLQEELLAAQTQYAQLQMLAKENPQIPVLQTKIRALEGAILAENNKVTGGAQSLAGRAAEYQRRLLEKEFADKMLAGALSGLESARNEAQRKSLYIERISQPSLPDAALEPKRLKSILAVFVLGLMLWGIGGMLLAGIKEHQD